MSGPLRFDLGAMLRRAPLLVSARKERAASARVRFRYEARRPPRFGGRPCRASKNPTHGSPDRSSLASAFVTVKSAIFTPRATCSHDSGIETVAPDVPRALSGAAIDLPRAF
jgi:hypothetical protein